ncbi:MAG: peptidyl-prolyl cis-trans isomerase [Holosporaceae bacterium]|jgi:peptidyl-prolyl cis-trans isomerase C|nr:peptidyl-prolyl cis-trans isomerase [Holosporaceae bacterium]
MKIKVIYTAALAVLFLDATYGGALKKSFTKDEQSKNLDIGGQNASSEEKDNSEPKEQVSKSSMEETNSKRAADSKPNVSSNSTERKKIVGDPIVLRINGKKEYRRSQILADMKAIPPQMVQGVSPDKLFEILRDQKSSTYLMIEQAKKAGLDHTKEFLDKQNQVTNELLVRELLIKELSPKVENESALKARYTKYLIEFKKGKEFKIYHIMVATEKEGNDILASLEKGDDFSELAKSKSSAPSKDKGGEEGYIPIDLMPPQVKDKVILLKVGEYTKDFVKTENGYHIFKVADIRDTTPQKYEEALPMLKQVLMHEEMVKLIERLEKQAKVEKFNEDGTPVGPMKEKLASPSV